MPPSVLAPWHALSFLDVPSPLNARQISNDVNSVKQTFTSWDSCMSKTYCKWPVIAVIIVGSLIALSLLFCLFRCLCCGVECCCGCFSCCNACCPSPRRNRDNQKYAPAPQQPYGYPPQQPPYFQPQAMGPMAYGAPAKPQFASFESPSMSGARSTGRIHEDSLPAMPSWDTAQTQHVDEPEPEHEIVEKHGVPEDAIPLRTNPQSPPLRQYNDPYDQQPYAARSELAGGDLGHAQQQSAYVQTGPYAQTHSPPPRSQATSPYAAGSAMSPPHGYNNVQQTPLSPAGSSYYGAQAAYPSAPQRQTAQAAYPQSAFTGYAPTGSTQYEPTAHTSYGAAQTPTSPVGNQAAYNPFRPGPQQHY